MSKQNLYSIIVERGNRREIFEYTTLHCVRLALVSLGSPLHPERWRNATVTIQRNGAMLATLTGSAIRDIFTAHGVDELKEKYVAPMR